MELQDLVENVPNLTDLELAVLLCLVADQHCLLYIDDTHIHDLAAELALIVSELFKLSYVVLEPQDLQSVEQFGESILNENRRHSDDPDLGDPSDSDAVTDLHSRIASVHMKAGSRNSLGERPDLDTRTVVNVVIAKNFNLAPHEVQIQILDLMQTHRIFSHTTVHRAPKTFLFLPIIARSTRDIRLNHHLNDRIFISHLHHPEDGFPNLEDLEDVAVPEDKDSTLSYSKASSSHNPGFNSRRVIHNRLIAQLRVLGQNTNITIEMRRYLQDVVIFLRIERGIDAGVTPYASVLFMDLAKYLAPLHGIDFVTPALVGLAAKKIYSHRLLIGPPTRDRSMQYGSDIGAVSHYLHRITPDDVIDAVLAKVDCPL